MGRFADVGLLVLASLASGPKHGYLMISDIKAFSGTALEPGTLYGALARLERLGWIAAMQAEDRRRPYRLTAQGQAALERQLKTMRTIVTVAEGRVGTV